MNIGRYKVRGLLGRGGMGSVYKVSIPAIDKIVALKLLNPVEHMVDLLGWEEIKRQFLKEAKLMARLRHPNIADVWDYGEHRGKPYFVMEYLCNNLGMVIGESYRVEEPTRRLRLDKAVKYALQTLKGLNRMHRAGIVHRDVKPFNILITDQDKIKIIDFGLSKLRGEASVGGPSNLKVGSPYYMAPEQERDPEQADARADLYSVGVMLFRMLTGSLPPEGGYFPKLSDRKSFSLKPWLPELNGEWDVFFRMALAEQPEHRFGSAQVMYDSLVKLYVRWKNQLDKVCGLPEAMEEAVEHIGDGAVQSSPLRSTPVRTGPKSRVQDFGPDLLDELGRPLRYAANDFAMDEDAVTDHVSNLMWQRSGSFFPMSWDEAHTYVASLNKQEFAGRSDWRLPTVDELSTLIQSAPVMADYCVDSVFDLSQNVLWSADRRSYITAWYCNAAMGFIGYQDTTCRFFVRAVCKA